jgi:uncharacterized protein YkwD
LPRQTAPRTVCPGRPSQPLISRRRTLDVTQPWSDEPPEARPPEPRHSHRSSDRLGPVGIAAIIAAVLVTLGIAAVVIPALLAGSPAPSNPPPAGGLPAGTVTVPSDQPSTDPTTGPTASAGPTRTAKLNIGRAEDAVIALVNDEREKARCGKVRNDGRLHDVARSHSEDMAEHNKLSHTGSDRSSPMDRMRDAGYRNPLAENVASGYATPQEVVAAWMASRGHRENMLNCNAKAIGVGLAYARNGTSYWTQDFGR